METNKGNNSQRPTWESKPTWGQLATTANIIAKQKPKSKKEYQDGWLCYTSDGCRFWDWDSALMHAVGHGLEIILKGCKSPVWYPGINKMPETKAKKKRPPHGNVRWNSHNPPTIAEGKRFGK